MDDGILAVTSVLDEEGQLLPSAHVQPSTTVYTYALFAATFDKAH
jgi:hypothetical protein